MEETNFEAKKASNLDSKNFWLLGLILSVIFVFIPVITWLINQDWMKTFSIIIWIGIALIIISFILIGLGSTGVGMGGSENLLEGNQGERVVHTQRKLLLLGIFKSRVHFQSWFLIWGLIYILPLVFGVPLFID